MPKKLKIFFSLVGFALFASVGSADGNSDYERKAQSIDFLLKENPTGLKKMGLLLERARVELAIAKTKTSREASAPLFQNAARITEQILSMKDVPVDISAEAETLLGFSLSELAQTRKAALHFEKSLKLNPSQPNAKKLNLFIADHYFSEGLHQRALAIYTALGDGLDANEQGRVAARILLCKGFLGQRSETALQSVFAAVDPKNPTDASIKDFAQLLALENDEAIILSKAAKLQSKEPAGRDRLWKTIFQETIFALHVSAPSKTWPLLLEKADDKDATADRRLELYLRELSSARFAVDRVYNKRLLLSVVKIFEGLSPVTKSRVADVEISDLTRAFDDAIAGWTSVLKKQTRTVASDAEFLETLSTFYLKSFPRSPNRSLIWRIRFSAAERSKQPTRVLQATSDAIADSSAASIHEEARSIRLGLLDELSSREPYRTQFEAELKELIQKKDRPDWSELAEALVALNVDRKDWKSAIPLLAEMYAREPGEAGFYRLQAARYANGAYDEVIDASQATHWRSPRLAAIDREASLRLATKLLESGGTDFGKHVDRFLTLNKDQRAAGLVIRGVLSKLIERKDWDKAAARLSSMSEGERKAANVCGAGKQVSVELMIRGSFEESLRPLCESGSEAERALARLGAGQPYREKLVAALPAPIRKRLQVLVALASPQQLVSELNQRPRLSLAEQETLFLALQVSSNSTRPNLDPKLKQLVAEALPSSEREDVPLPVEKKIDSVRLPAMESNEKVYNERLLAAISKTREIRAKLAKALRNQTAKTQGRVLERAAQLENSVSNAIDKAPVPAAIQKSAEPAYREGLAKLSGEFRAQESAYKSTLQKLNTRVERSVASESVPNANLQVWPWPANNVGGEIRDLISRKKLLPVLIALDLMKEKGRVSEKDFFALRSGALLTMNNSEAMRSFVWHELKSAGRQEIWK